MIDTTDPTKTNLREATVRGTSFPHAVRFHVGFWVLLVLLLLGIILATGAGAVRIAPRTVFLILFNHSGMGHVSPSWLPSAETIIFRLRLPRVLVVAFIGASLSVAVVLSLAHL